MHMRNNMYRYILIKTTTMLFMEIETIINLCNIYPDYRNAVVRHAHLWHLKGIYGFTFQTGFQLSLVPFSVLDVCAECYSA